MFSGVTFRKLPKSTSLISTKQVSKSCLDGPGFRVKPKWGLFFDVFYRIIRNPNMFSRVNDGKCAFHSDVAMAQRI